MWNSWVHYYNGKVECPFIMSTWQIQQKENKNRVETDGYVMSQIGPQLVLSITC
jgi:hypothetical protein